MAMYKAASELISLADDEEVMLPITLMPSHNNDLVLSLEQFEPEVSLSEEKEHPISFALSKLPGCEDAELIELSDGDEVEEEPEKKEDKSKVVDHPKDLNWMKSCLDNTPKHRGETLGLERAQSYLEHHLGQLSKMIQNDHEGKIDIAHAEDARIEIEKGIDRLKAELAKRKKKASPEDTSLTKEGQKIPVVGGIVITVPLKISRIARVCINATVSAGKDMEDVFWKQAEKWKLTEDEREDVIQLIQDLGYAIRRDRGFMIDDKKPYHYTSTDNFDFPANYQG